MPTPAHQCNTHLLVIVIIIIIIINLVIIVPVLAP